MQKKKIIMITSGIILIALTVICYNHSSSVSNNYRRSENSSKLFNVLGGQKIASDRFPAQTHESGDHDWSSCVHLKGVYHCPIASGHPNTVATIVNIYEDSSHLKMDFMYDTKASKKSSPFEITGQMQEVATGDFFLGSCMRGSIIFTQLFFPPNVLDVFTYSIERVEDINIAIRNKISAELHPYKDISSGRRDIICSRQ